MVKLRLFAAGGPKDCWIEEDAGSVIESVGNAPAAGSTVKPKMKRKAHPPSLVNGQPAEYIQRLVETKLREGWQVVNSEEENAAQRLHLLIRTPPGYASSHYRDIVTSFGIESPVSGQESILGSTRCMFENVEVSTEGDGATTVITAISSSQSAPALATLFLTLSKASQATYGDGKPAKLMEIVLRARDQGLIKSEYLEAAYAFNAVPRPFNVAALRTTDRRSRFSVSI